MSSTNKTSNYELSQYIGTDKPTYLGDYNGDMLKIDNQMKTNENSATEAISQAGQAVAKATSLEGQVKTISESVKSLLNDVTTIKNNVSQNEDNIGSIQKRILALEGKATAIDSQISDIQNRLNTQWVNSANVINTAIPALSVSTSFLYVGYNKLTEMLSIYFYVEKTLVTSTPSGQVIGTIPPEIMGLLNINSPRTIVNGCDVSYESANVYYNVGKNLKIDTNGQISIIGGATVSTAYIQTNLMLNTSAWS